jgi:hypothetical protein
VHTAIVQALLVYSIAFVMSMVVALLIKALYCALRSLSDR